MMLNGVAPVVGVTIPDIFKSKMLLATQCIIPDDILKIFNTALSLVNNAYWTDVCSGEVDLDTMAPVNIVFTKTGNIHFAGEHGIKEYGSCNHFICYRIDYLISHSDDRFIRFVFVEELVHHFWRIIDETDAKHKVLKIIQPYDNSITIETLKGWGVSV